MEQVKVYSGLLPLALRAKHARPLALWTLARALDDFGSGIVAVDDVHQAAATLMSRATFYRGISDGAAFGYWRIIERAPGRRELVLTGLLSLAKRHGLSHVGKVAHLANLTCLASVADLRAAHHAALVASHATHTPTVHALDKAIGAVRRLGNAQLERALKAKRRYGSPISRQTLANMGSANRRSQRRYEIRAGANLGVTIKTKRNLRRVGLPAELLDYARDNTHAGCHLYGAVVVQRLPDSRSTNMPRAGRGRNRKVNHALVSLVNSEAGAPVQRIFYPSVDHANRSKREGPKLVATGRTYHGAQLWTDLVGPELPPRALPALGMSDEVRKNWAKVTESQNCHI